MFRASRNWLALREFVPSIKRHAENDPVARKYRPEYDVSVNFTLIFKQLFCAAAQQLANLLHEPLENLGVLFEEPLETGAIYIPALTGDVTRRASSYRPKSIDAEGSTQAQMLARGKYLLLNRQLRSDEAAKFATLGYRFAPVGQVAELLAKNMQVERTIVVDRLERMRLSVSADRLPPPGVHLACFMIRPSIYKGFDILVPAITQNQLPFATILSDKLSERQIEQLQSLDNLTINDILRDLSNSSSGLQIDEEFRWQLRKSFVKLADIVGDPHLMMLAKFSAKGFPIPCRSTLDSTSPGNCTLLIVRLLCNIHVSSTKQELTFVPLSFFGEQQQLESNSPGDKSFARRLKMEFEHLGDPQSGYKGTSEVNITSRVGSAGTTPKSPKLVFLDFIKGGIYPSRLSDEITMVDREKRSKERGDIEMSVLETGIPVTQVDLTDLTSTGPKTGSWVSETFSLFQLWDEWGSSGRPAWKWDINVENSYEVVNKDYNNI